MSPTVEGAFIVPDLQATIRPFDWAGEMPNQGPGPNLVFLEPEHDRPSPTSSRACTGCGRREVRPPVGGKPIVEGFQLEPDVLAAHRGGLATIAARTGHARADPKCGPAPHECAAGALPADVTWRSGWRRCNG